MAGLAGLRCHCVSGCCEFNRGYAVQVVCRLFEVHRPIVARVGLGRGEQSRSRALVRKTVANDRRSCSGDSGLSWTVRTSPGEARRFEGIHGAEIVGPSPAVPTRGPSLWSSDQRPAVDIGAETASELSMRRSAAPTVDHASSLLGFSAPR
jgi:hypothetical protein